MARIKYYNTETQTWEKADIAGKESKTTNIVHNLYEAEAKGKYDLKDGYGYTADIYIATDGTETTRTGLNYTCFDYIPVEAGVSYTACCIGYALYDSEKTFVRAVMTSIYAVQEFTPETSGFVRLTFSGSSVEFSRFCKTEDARKCYADYMPERSPFSDPTIPCDVRMYGDSNSVGYGLSDTANGWANRLGELITGMPEDIQNWPMPNMSVFAMEYQRSPKLGNCGRIYMSAYTNKFEVVGEYIGTVKVLIDGVECADMTATPALYEVDLGYHTIELQGAVGNNNIIKYITTSRPRTFVNNAVTGTNTEKLFQYTPDGNIILVMYGTNDRSLHYGKTAYWLTRFIRECNKIGAKVFLFSPIPTKSGGETHSSYAKTINEVINEIPNVNYIDVYKDMQLFSLLSTESLYNDSLHLNDYGHKVLYCIAASGLHLASLNSIFDE